MKTIEISKSSFLQITNDIEEPVLLHHYNYLPYRYEQFEVKRIQTIIQIFHTHLKHFDLRKATLIDPDERRPIYSFKFDSEEKHANFMSKRAPYIMAFQQIEFIDVDGEVVIGAVRTGGDDLYRLRSFTAWLEQITGQIKSNYVADCNVIEIENGSMLNIPDITIDDLVACLKGEKLLVSKDPEDDLSTREITIDGVTLKPDELLKHMLQKAVLERMETCAAN